MTTKMENNHSRDFFGITMTTDSAFHGLRVDRLGNLIYSKIKLTGNESIEMTNGNGIAYIGIEEFVRGTTESGVMHNEIPFGEHEVSRKDSYGEEFQVEVLNNHTPNPTLTVASTTSQEIDLVKGATYRFIVSDQSTEGFPIYISTYTGSTGFEYEYTKGVINSRAAYGGSQSDPNTITDQPLEFTVPNDSPDILYLSSGNHSDVYIKMYTNRLGLADLVNRKYNQVRFDEMDVTYYINENGFLVARYNNQINLEENPGDFSTSPGETNVY